ncbi:MAG: GNAT family N-acetyltransferase [Saprospiraceae bacterium]|nr:GNAT family N-acetyltransferase [Lewinella sp.]
MMTYKVLKKQIFEAGKYTIVPIRMEDRYDIMRWRNEQLYHLRQNKPLTKEDQDHYFTTVVSKIFDHDRPDQILFSYLENDRCIGYGGLVHINWIDGNAEISFVLKTVLEKDHFEFHWQKFLALLEKAAFFSLDFHKIYTYAYDIRPRIYTALENAGFTRDAILKEHCKIDGHYRNVIIHSKINISHKIRYRSVCADDVTLLYEWVNDESVRRNAIHTEKISWQEHYSWFQQKLSDEKNKIFIFSLDDEPVGQVRLDYDDGYWLIDYSVAKNHRGKNIGKSLISQIINFEKFRPLKAVVKAQNLPSLRVFSSLGFIESGEPEGREPEVKTFYFQ